MPKFEKLSKKFNRVFGNPDLEESPEESEKESLADTMTAFYENMLKPKMDEADQERQKLSDDSTEALKDKIRAMQGQPTKMSPEEASEANRRYAESMLGNVMAGISSRGVPSSYLSKEAAEAAIAKGEGLAAKAMKPKKSYMEGITAEDVEAAIPKDEGKFAALRKRLWRE